MSIGISSVSIFHILIIFINIGFVEYISNIR